MVWGSASVRSCDDLLERVERNDPLLTELVILPIKSFGDNELERLAAALQRHGHDGHLMTVSASGHSVSNESLLSLGKDLVNSNVKELAIGDSTMGDEGVESLLRPFHEYDNGIVSSFKLRKLDLSDKRIGERGMAALGKTPLLVGKSLTELILSRNPDIDSQAMQSFCTQHISSSVGRSGLDSLSVLDLMECRIDGAGLQSLADLLDRSTTNDLHLKMNMNPLGPSSGESLGQISKHLRSLEVSGCELGNEGMQKLCQQISRETNSLTLASMDLSRNGIGPGGAEALSRLIQDTKCESLSHINLAGNPLDPTGVQKLTNGSVRLKSLDLSGTRCGINGAVAVLKNLRVEKLRLFQNQLSGVGFRAIADVLTELNSDCPLVELDLCGNGADAASVARLLDALPMGIKLLEIGGNCITPELEERIRHLIDERNGLDIARDKPQSTHRTRTWIETSPHTE